MIKNSVKRLNDTMQYLKKTLWHVWRLIAWLGKWIQRKYIIFRHLCGQLFCRTLMVGDRCVLNFDDVAYRQVICSQGDIPRFAFFINRVVIVVNEQTVDTYCEFIHKLMMKYPGATFYLKYVLPKGVDVKSRLMDKIARCVHHGGFDIIHHSQADPAQIYKVFFGYRRTLLKLKSLPKEVFFYDEVPKSPFFSKAIELKTGVAILAVWLLVLMGLFRASYSQNVALLSELKNASDVLCYEMRYGSDEQRAAAISALYLSYQKTKWLNFHLSYLGLYRANVISQNIKTLLMMALMRDLYYPTLKVIQHKLVFMNQHWRFLSEAEKNKVRGRYYGDLLVYMDLRYPHYIVLPAVLAVTNHGWPSRSLFTKSMQVQLVAFLLNQLKSLSANQTNFIDDPLYFKAKEQLQLQDNLENVYALFNRLSQLTQGKLSLDDLLPSNTVMFSDQAVTSVYTKLKWHDYVQKQLLFIAKHYQSYVWFMQSGSGNASFENLYSHLVDRYLKDYYQAWINLISSIRIRHYQNMLQVMQLLSNLTQKKNAFYQFMEVISRNAIAVKSSMQFANKKDFDFLQHLSFESYKKSLLQMIADGHNILISDDLGSAYVNYSQQLLASHSLQFGPQQLSASVNQMISGINNIALAKAMKHYLLLPAANFWYSVMLHAADKIKADYQQSVLSYYQKNLLDRFPFSKTDGDVDPENLKNWLLPEQGMLWRFVTSDCLHFLALSNGHWRIVTWLGKGLPVSRDFLTHLNAWQALSSFLFRHGRYDAAMWLHPMPSKQIESLALSANGQSFVYQNGPEAWQKIIWQPSDKQTTLSVLATTPINTIHLSFSGPWGLLRLLSQFTIQASHIVLKQNPAIRLKMKPLNIIRALQVLQRPMTNF